MADPQPDAVSLYRRWIGEVWAGEPIPGDLVADGFVGHWPDREVRGRAELAAIIGQTRQMFGSLDFEIVLGPLVDGHFVAGRWRGVGRHDDGEMRFTGNDILRLEHGRVAEYWTGTSSG